MKLLASLLHVQLCNTGSVVALDEVAYRSRNADFMVAMTDMLMTGFPVAVPA